MDNQKLINNSFLRDFNTATGNGRFILTGGAVYDVLKDRLVKDWDFEMSHKLKSKLDEIAEFISSSSTATTYRYDGQIVQLLNKDKSAFPFTIEQSTYNITTNELKIDEASYKSGILIPTSNVYHTDDYRAIINCLRRAIHWKKKGMRLPDITYSSLLNLIKPKGQREEEYES